MNHCSATLSTNGVQQRVHAGMVGGVEDARPGAVLGGDVGRSARVIVARLVACRAARPCRAPGGRASRPGPCRNSALSITELWIRMFSMNTVSPNLYARPYSGPAAEAVDQVGVGQRSSASSRPRARVRRGTRRPPGPGAPASALEHARGGLVVSVEPPPLARERRDRRRAAGSRGRARRRRAPRRPRPPIGVSALAHERDRARAAHLGEPQRLERVLGRGPSSEATNTSASVRAGAEPRQISS